MIYFILHGFASATPNETSAFFAANFPNDTIVNLNYSFDPKLAENELVEQVLKQTSIPCHTIHDTEWTFVGGSLGGFMAQWLAMAFAGKAIVINPAVIPYEDLTRFLGVNTNYKTGEEFELTMEQIERFKDFAVDPGRVPTLVLLDMGDELLDSAETVKHFDGKAKIVTFEGGTHRFNHLPESLEAIKEFGNTLV
jgi:predicted esterase YcpF (UPF0227 family)